MSKAFTSDDTVAPEAQVSLPVGRRPITARGLAKLRTAHRALLAELAPFAGARPGDGALNVQVQLQALQRRLAQLERRIELSDVAPEPAPSPSTVVLGSRVVVREAEGGERLVYALVGPDEVDMTARRISHASPVGQALLGRRVGERAFLKRPAGILEVHVESIEADGAA